MNGDGLQWLLFYILCWSQEACVQTLEGICVHIVRFKDVQLCVYVKPGFIVAYFSLFNAAAEHSSAFAVLPGNVVCNLDYVGCEEGLFGRQENAGFLYFRPSYQCLQGFTIPQTPFLVATLILQSEVVWAKILPLRLLLRLGSEYRCK